MYREQVSTVITGRVQINASTRRFLGFAVAACFAVGLARAEQPDLEAAFGSTRTEVSHRSALNAQRFGGVRLQMRRYALEGVRFNAEGSNLTDEAFSYLDLRPLRPFTVVGADELSVGPADPVAKNVQFMAVPVAAGRTFLAAFMEIKNAPEHHGVSALTIVDSDGEVLDQSIGTPFSGLSRNPRTSAVVRWQPGADKALLTLHRYYEEAIPYRGSKGKSCLVWDASRETLMARAARSQTAKN